MHRTRRLALVLALSTLVIGSVGPPVAAADRAPAAEAAAGWRWPAAPRVVRPFLAPAHPYGAGHRGIDLAVGGSADVVAPAAGVVAFAGRVVDRTLVTIDHGGGLVTTLEPVDPLVAPGDVVTAGTPIGRPSTGGHAEPGTVHFGVRVDGVYINPLLLLGDIPRAVLLPCC